jgi:hypothetical protein
LAERFRLRRLWGVARLPLGIAVVVLSAVGFAEGARTAQSQDAEWTAPAAAAFNQAEFSVFACREAEFRADVPRGAPIFIGQGPVLWVQRMAEFASGWATPVSAPGAARYEVESGPDGGACNGAFGFRVVSG